MTPSCLTTSLHEPRFFFFSARPEPLRLVFCARGGDEMGTDSIQTMLPSFCFSPMATDSRACMSIFALGVFLEAPGDVQSTETKK